MWFPKPVRVYYFDKQNYDDVACFKDLLWLEKKVHFDKFEDLVLKCIAHIISLISFTHLEVFSFLKSWYF